MPAPATAPANNGYGTGPLANTNVNPYTPYPTQNANLRDFSSPGATGGAGPGAPATGAADAFEFGPGTAAGDAARNGASVVGVSANGQPILAPPPPPPPPPTPNPLAQALAFAEAQAGSNSPGGFMTPAMQTYINQFQQSQAQQQQAMNAALTQALVGLGQRRDAAAKVAATLPGTYNAAYNQALQANLGASKAAKGAFQGSGSAAIAPVVKQGMAEERAAGQASQPLINAGITADYSKGATTLANTNMSNEAGLAANQQAFDAQILQDQIQAGNQAQQYKQQLGQDVLASALGVNAYKQENPNAALTPQQQEQLGVRQTLDTNAAQHGFTGYAQYQETVQSPAYQWALPAVVSGGKNLQAGQNVPGLGVVPRGLDSTAKVVQWVAQTNPLVLAALTMQGLIPATATAGI